MIDELKAIMVFVHWRPYSAEKINQPSPDTVHFRSKQGNFVTEQYIFIRSKLFVLTLSIPIKIASQYAFKVIDKGD